MVMSVSSSSAVTYEKHKIENKNEEKDPVEMMLGEKKNGRKETVAETVTRPTFDEERTVRGTVVSEDGEVPERVGSAVNASTDSFVTDETGETLVTCDSVSLGSIGGSIEENFGHPRS